MKKIVINKISGKDNSQVVGVTIENLKNIQKFPRGFGGVFPNLMFFQIRRCSLAMLTKEDFYDLGTLRGLWLPENLLKSLPSDIFMNLQGLRHLCFYKNHLKFIGADILNPLKVLERANFNENACINMSYDKDKDPPEKLQQLKQEIIEKCSVPSSSTSSMTVVPNNTNEIENRFRILEDQIKLLKDENQYLTAKIALIAPLEAKVENLKKKLNELETNMLIN